MAAIKLKDRIKQGVFFLDGAMGTQLAAHGIEMGHCNDYQNIESPAIVEAIHQQYFNAGSDAVLTNTFGANKYALARHKLADKVYEINKAAAHIARKAAGNNRYVLGDIGPCGDFLAPLGLLKPEELNEAFALQALALKAGGVDGFIIETMTALEEILVAIQAVKSVTSLPVFASMSYDKAGDNFRTMMGVAPEDAITKITALGVDALGFNCGKMSLDDYRCLAKKYASIVKDVNSDASMLAEVNAGLPELVGTQAVYNVTGQQFAQALKDIHETGFNILGGCCGSNPELIKAAACLLK
ncbi:MAG TPA: homocysteine S-methyltransferase family protein [Sedimentisphaerales bacterium]|nr:homocysteine S-methyltransferase family protein [Sedimentisphaerales bacterium]